MSDSVVDLLKSALAALSQNATFPADIELAKSRISDALSQLTPSAVDAAAAPFTKDEMRIYHNHIAGGSA